LNNHQAADAIALARARIVNDVTFLDLAGIDAEKKPVYPRNISPELERQRTKLVAVAGLDVNDFVRGQLDALRAGNIQRPGR